MQTPDASIDSTRQGAESSLAGLQMPGPMRNLLRAALAPPCGVVVVVSETPTDRTETMAALAGARVVSGTTAELDTLSGTDCDTLMIEGALDRRTAERAFAIAEAGPRILIGMDAADSMAAMAMLRGLRVDRHAIAFGLRAVIAVRQARRLCEACRIPDQARGSEAALLGVDPGTVIYRPAGCGACDGTGYAGMLSIYETMAVDAALRRLIAEGGDAGILARHAFLNTPRLSGSARTLAREGAIPAHIAIDIGRAHMPGASGTGGDGVHPHLLPSFSQRLDGGANPPLSAPLHGDRSSIG